MMLRECKTFSLKHVCCNRKKVLQCEIIFFVVKFLFEHAADANRASGDGDTQYNAALRNGHSAIAQLLAYSGSAR
jgi:hypothetical protein